MKTAHEQFWLPVTEVLRKRIGADAFERWFAEVEVKGLEEKEVFLQVPNAIHQFFIESNFLSVLRATFMENGLGERDVRFVLSSAETKNASAGKDGKREASDTALPAQEVATSGRSSSSRTGQGKASLGMNPRNTFDTFVVGSGSQFAHAASLAVAQSPAKNYNPLFIYGGSGLGKTHLLQAIGHHVLASKPECRVAYVSCEHFTNEFIDAIQHGSTVKFRRRYRQVDVLMIDDIQFLAGRERSQEEFFHTFNALHDGHKQIVLSSDRAASEIEKLEQRLVSRFEWGLTAELQPPDLETRMAILRKKSEAMEIALQGWVLEFLADRIRNNVRRLEGALMRVATYKSMSGQSLNQEIIENLLRDILQEQARRAVTVDQIQRRVAEHYDIRLADMTSKRRPAHIAFPRQVAMYLSRQLTRASLNEIGDSFGGRDHGTVIHADKLIRKRIASDEKVRQEIRMLENQLQR